MEQGDGLNVQHDILARGNGQILPSVFFKRGEKLEYMRPGSTFQHLRDDNLIEIACVESLGTDLYGIPHVRFQISLTRDKKFLDFDKGTRMLALSSFADRYRERIVI
ncbi:MAG: hypothetical protein CMM44_11235 [Rhodospirillaceae bacterium]|mgnify:CR=1 FL=1|nr:hypothetical protein [Rhodospirillaceae bacterium]|tara:strand:- start:3637 stop:3957 length:321 start_codon:yes stop_codon:yes gene_type:complete